MRPILVLCSLGLMACTGDTDPEELGLTRPDRSNCTLVRTSDVEADGVDDFIETLALDSQEREVTSLFTFPGGNVDEEHIYEGDCLVEHRIEVTYDGGPFIRDILTQNCDDDGNPLDSLQVIREGSSDVVTDTSTIEKMYDRTYDDLGLPLTAFIVTISTSNGTRSVDESYTHDANGRLIQTLWNGGTGDFAYDFEYLEDTDIIQISELRNPEGALLEGSYTTFDPHGRNLERRNFSLDAAEQIVTATWELDAWIPVEETLETNGNLVRSTTYDCEGGDPYTSCRSEIDGIPDGSALVDGVVDQTGSQTFDCP